MNSRKELITTQYFTESMNKNLLLMSTWSDWLSGGPLSRWNGITVVKYWNVKYYMLVHRSIYWISSTKTKEGDYASVSVAY